MDLLVSAAQALGRPPMAHPAMGFPPAPGPGARRRGGRARTGQARYAACRLEGQSNRAVSGGDGGARGTGTWPDVGPAHRLNGWFPSGALSAPGVGVYSSAGERSEALRPRGSSTTSNLTF